MKRLLYIGEMLPEVHKGKRSLDKGRLGSTQLCMLRCFKLSRRWSTASKSKFAE